MPNALKQRIPDFSIIWKYSQSPANPSAAIKRKKTTSLPVKTTANAIAHIATALTSLRKKRLMKECCRGACHKRNVASSPQPVGRKTRRANGVFAGFKLFRAGFEPLRGPSRSWSRKRSNRRLRLRSRIPLGDAALTKRLKTGAMSSNKKSCSLARRVFRPTTPSLASTRPTNARSRRRVLVTAKCGALQRRRNSPTDRMWPRLHGRRR